MKKKIFFVIPTLAGGGAERVFVNLVKEIDKSLYEVTLIYLSSINKVYEVPSNVHEVDLKVKRVGRAPMRLLKLIRREKPDVVISTLGHMNLLMLLLKNFFPKKTKLVTRLTNIPSKNLSANPINKFIQKKMYILYKLSDKTICQSELMKNDFVKYSHISQKKVIKIFNPVDFNEILYKSKEDPQYNFSKEEKSIFFVGRLNEVKRIPLIIDAFQEYLFKNPSSKLYILGDGPKKSELIEYADDQNLSDHIIFLGFQKNIYKWLKHADLFILASRSEGMPNVLIEAIALEVPVLVLKHPGGTEDIIKCLGLHDKFVGDLVIKEKSFQNYKKDIHDKLVSNFSIENITKQYENVVQSVLNKG
ncbi:Glycosyltransferase involved in cell wall bisynthesis [Lentibacillus persicus]|uniref:Glycosyltransferase involved in cell wall bisynthesis n=1 Tax=Lentibacillus persicus TaxID=640948 RepID=A0A1I1VVR7_9BACI|nr:glycosyltransferase [Lentibacillus persicus]SFD86935.1 Glycosyltransferase involved in cell wall bisynthesis [Lentibacillus persicus]